MTHDPTVRYHTELEQLRTQGLLRHLRTVSAPTGRTIRVDGREVLAFCSNDYLGLANHPAIIAAAKQGLDQWGYGAGASRLISGHTQAHEALQERLADWLGHEAALVLPSGYAANLAVLQTLCQPGDLVAIDKLVHASLVDGARGGAGALRVWPHRQTDKLRRLLAQRDYDQAWIVTDSLFSMDGDVADLRELVALKREFNALLVVDEAHAIGCIGPDGKGLAAVQDVLAEVDVLIVTLSKALGGHGGAVVTNRTFVDYLVNRARGFIFTTAAPATHCLAAQAALDIVAAEPDRRRRLQENAAYLREQLTGVGYDIGHSESYIIPIILGDAARTTELAQRLLDQDIFVPAVRPPTVAPNACRLRISLTATHTRADIDHLLDVLRKR